MARSFEVALPPVQCEDLIRRVRGKPGVVAISLQRGASIEPAGDVLTVWTSNEGAATVLHALDVLRPGDDCSFTVSEPTSVVAHPRQHSIEHESNEGSWEEVTSLLRRDTNLSTNFFLLMTFSGAVAAAGLWNDTLHIVIGAMLIAPGFEPIVRAPFALIGARGQGLWRGIAGTVLGYACLAIGAAIMLVLLAAFGDSSGSEALRDRGLVQYWTSLGLSDALIALTAGAAGATIIATQRTVFGAGVMVALALIPSMAIVSMALVFGELGLAGQAAMRWGLDVVCVLIASSIVFGLKQLLRHRRQSLSRLDYAQVHRSPAIP